MNRHTNVHIDVVGGTYISGLRRDPAMNTVTAMRIARRRYHQLQTTARKT